MSIIQNLKWRYATKKYDTNKKIKEEDLETIKEALQLSASSYGLQLYKFILVENPEIREKLKEAAWGQSQVTDASHLLVFASYSDIQENDIDSFINLNATEKGIEASQLQGYGDFIKSKILPLPQETKQIWLDKQCYIALGNLLNVAAELKIDTTPMEGFDPKQFDEILGLEKLGLKSTVVATLGYRSVEDASALGPKVRKSQEDLFAVI